MRKSASAFLPIPVAPENAFDGAKPSERSVNGLIPVTPKEYKPAAVVVPVLIPMVEIEAVASVPAYQPANVVLLDQVVLEVDGSESKFWEYDPAKLTCADAIVARHRGPAIRMSFFTFCSSRVPKIRDNDEILYQKSKMNS